MFKEFLMKKMLKAKGASDDQINMILALVEKNPELFQKIAGEIEIRVKEGKNQEQAAMEVMMSHQDELKKLM
jgi:hypothetical protein